MNRPTLSERLNYWFDNTMSRGPQALVGWLGLVTVFVILVFGVLVWFFGVGSQERLIEQIWAFVMLALEPDAMTFGHWVFRVATIVIVLTSIFVLSSLIGIITTGMDAKIAELRKGRSRVIEAGHTVILGWSSEVVPVISELIVANENQRDSCIVVLADRPKDQMEDEIRHKVPNTGRTRVVCRRGQPMDIDDLKIANLGSCKSIIIMAPEQDAPDTKVIKMLLAIRKHFSVANAGAMLVAEVQNEESIDVARIIMKHRAEFVLSNHLIARIAAQTCRQSGLSVVYTELLDFEGDEIYFQREPQLVGTSFGDALHAYEDSSIIGIKRAGESPRLNPPKPSFIEDGDQLIAISLDDDTIIMTGAGDALIQEAAIVHHDPTPPNPEEVLMLGWNSQAPFIIREMDRYVASGSSLTVLAGTARAEVECQMSCQSLSTLKCSFVRGDITDRHVLESIGLEGVDHVILLADTLERTNEEADATTLVTLLRLRDIAESSGYRFSIVSEILDIRNRDLAEMARADDFIVSDRLVSLALAQISENQELAGVFDDLFSADGAEIYIRPIVDYVDVDRPLNFHTVLESAKRRDEIAIGYRIKRDALDPEKAYGVVLNPRKSEMVKYSEEDQVIVLSEG